MDNTQEPTNITDLATKRYTKQQTYEGRQKFILNQLKHSTHGAYRSDKVYPERLIFAREMLGFTQDDWAEILGILPMEYQMWENGTAQPTVEQLHDLAETTGMFKPGWFCHPVESGWPDMEETTLRFH